MRLSLHTVICCCVFTTVLPPVKGATGELNGSLKRRFRVWLQGHTKRDQRNSLMTAGEQTSAIHAGSQQGGHAKALPPLSSFGLNLRPKRSTSSKHAGCVFVTCLYHDLIHRLHDLNNKQKEDKAPQKRIDPTGYGRRRRSLLDSTCLLDRETQTEHGSLCATSTVSLAAVSEDLL